MIYYCESDRNFLAHYGIPGMKWGRRKHLLSGYDRRRLASDISKTIVGHDMSKSRKNIQRLKKRIKKEANLNSSETYNALKDKTREYYKSSGEKGAHEMYQLNKKLTNELIGLYGNKKIKGGYVRTNTGNFKKVKEVVSDTLRDMVDDDIYNVK